MNLKETTYLKKNNLHMMYTLTYTTEVRKSKKNKTNNNNDTKMCRCSIYLYKP